MRPLKIKSSATPATSSNFEGLQEMTDAEIEQYISAVITKKFADDTDGSGTAEINIDTANALSGATIGTFVDTKRTEAIGTHPASTGTSDTTYYAKQVDSVASSSISDRPTGWDTTLGGIKEFTDAELNTDIIDKVIADMVGGSDYTVGTYKLSVNAPTGGTWTQRYTLTNTYGGTNNTTNTIGIWQQTSPVSSSNANLYPVKVYNTSNLKGATQAEVEQLVPLFRNRIMSTDIGTYQLSSSSPGTGTWVKMGDAGGFTDTRQVVSPSDYSGTYNQGYSGDYSGTYTGPVSFSGTYTEPYTGSYVGPVNYTGSYTGNFTGTYTGPVNYAGAYVGSFAGAYAGTYTGPVGYSGTYNQGFTGAYAGVYSGTRAYAYTGTWSGSYILYYGGYANSAWTGAYTGSYIGYFSGNYTGYYSGTYVGQFTGVYAGPVNFTGSYTGTYNQSFTGIYVGPVSYAGSYSQAFSGVYVGPVTYSGTYSADYTGAYVGPVNFTGTYTGVYTAAYTGIYASNTVQASTENVSSVYLWMRTA